MGFQVLEVSSKVKDEPNMNTNSYFILVAICLIYLFDLSTSYETFGLRFSSQINIFKSAYLFFKNLKFNNIHFGWFLKSTRNVMLICSDV